MTSKLEVAKGAAGVAATLAVIAVVAYIMQPHATAPEHTNLVAKAPPAVRSYDLVIKGGQLTGGPGEIDAVQHDLINLNVTSDTAATLEVPDFGKKLSLTPGATTKLQFTVDKPGEFNIQLDNHAPPLGIISVEPVNQ
jgi:heme/copper-type cytochrome/quinol oxidase subunit 2